MNGNELKDYILKLDNKKQIEFLTNKEVRKTFLLSENHYPFVWLIQELSDNKLEVFLDEEMINMLIKNDRHLDKINALMNCANSYKNNILVNPLLMNIILETNNGLITYISSLDYNFGINMVEFAIHNNRLDILNLIGRLDGKEQLLVFNSDIISKIIKLDLDSKFLFSLDGRVIAKLIKYEKFLNIFLNFKDIELINILDTGFIFPDNLINSKKIITKISRIPDIKKYRSIIKKMYINNYSFADLIEKKRLKYLKEEVEFMSKDGILKSYCDLKNKLNEGTISLFDVFPFGVAYDIQISKEDKKILLKETFINLSFNKALEMTLDLYFKDYPGNILVNIKEIIKYISKINLEIIPKDRFDFYQSLYNFDELSMSDFKKLILQYDSNIDYAKFFYEDYNTCKNYSYKNLNNSLFDPNKDTLLINNDLVNQYKIPIYELKGQEFYACVHCTYTTSEKLWKEKSDVISLSIIGSDNISVYKEDGIIFGFDNLDINNIINVYNSDSYSNRISGTDKINKIYTPKDLLKESVGYTELLYNEKNGVLKPSYIVSFDVIKDKEQEIAQKLQIPILLIHSRYYKKSVGINDLQKDSYPENRDIDYKSLR